MSIAITIEERMPKMLEENIDIVFDVNWPPNEDIVARRLLTTNYIFCASPRYLSTQKLTRLKISLPYST